MKECWFLYLTLLARLVIIPTDLTPIHWFLYDSQEFVLVQPEAYLQLSQTYMMELFLWK